MKIALQTKARGSSEGTRLAPPFIHEALRSNGHAMEKDVRESMEARFGHDFRQVRIHIDPRAAESAKAIDALAYTVGRNIVFGAGKYAPQTPAGQGLLVHELAHVVQQRAISSLPIPTTLAIGPSADAAERSADQQARAVVGDDHTEPVTNLAAPAVLQRQPTGPEFDSTRREPGDRAIVTHPATQTIPAAQAVAVKEPETRAPIAETGKPESEKATFSYSEAIESEVKREDGKLQAETTPSFKLGAVIPVAKKLQFHKILFFKELESEGSASTSTSGSSSLTAVELMAAQKLVSYDYENVKKTLEVGASGVAQASVGYSLTDHKRITKLGFGAGLDATYTPDKGHFFITMSVGVEKTYDQEGNASFKWSPAVWKASFGVGIQF
jgi:hypothetical protein